MLAQTIATNADGNRERRAPANVGKPRGSHVEGRPTSGFVKRLPGVERGRPIRKAFKGLRRTYSHLAFWKLTVHAVALCVTL